MNFSLYAEDRKLLLSLLPSDHHLAVTLRAYPALEKRWSALLRRCDRLSRRSRKSAVERLRKDVAEFSDLLRREHPSLEPEGIYLSSVFLIGSAFVRGRK